MDIYSISIAGWISRSVTYFILTGVVLLVGFLCREILKTGVEVLLSVLKIKATDYDDDPAKDKTILLAIWCFLIVFLGFAIIMLTRINIQTIEYIYKAKYADTWVSGKAIVLDTEEVIESRGGYIGQEVYLEVNGIMLIISRADPIDDEAFERLTNAEKVSVLYTEDCGDNVVVQIRVDE